MVCSPRRAVSRGPCDRLKSGCAPERWRCFGVVDLKAYADPCRRTLAYGLQRKLEIARALALQPKLLLLDEPAAGMNPQESLDLVDLIKRIHERMQLTVILIEHHMDVVMNLCDRIAVLNFGKKIAEGTPDEIQSTRWCWKPIWARRSNMLLQG